MFEPLGHGPAAPFFSDLFGGRVSTAKFISQRDEPFGRLWIAVENDVFARVAQFGVNRIVNIKLTRVDDRHIKPSRDCIIQEHTVHRAADGLIAPE